MIPLIPRRRNLRLDPLGGETSTPLSSNLVSIPTMGRSKSIIHRMPVAGKVLSMDQRKADNPIVRAVEDDDGDTADIPARTELLCSIR